MINQDEKFQCYQSSIQVISLRTQIIFYHVAKWSELTFIKTNIPSEIISL